MRSEDVYVSIIQGMEVALENPLEGQLPDNSNLSVLVASLPAFFSMKAVALSLREKLKKTKDAYDIVYCLRNYPGGSDAMVEEFRRAISNPIVASSVELLKNLFASIDAVGPVAYAMGADDFEDAALKQREAFERVTELLSKLERGE